MKKIITLRNVQEEDSFLLEKLASDCPPLDIHTPYTYWVIARFFGSSSFIAECDGQPVGYITSVENNTELLIWQIGLTNSVRGMGLAEKLIDKVVEYGLAEDKLIYVSIDKNNLPSNAAFSGYCRRYGLKMTRVKNVSLNSAVIPSFSESEELFLIAKD